MAKQIINLGTGELTGDGESIRSAFDKVNDNFTETYNDIANISTFNGDYNSLTNKPVLFSGDYNDLTNQPTLFDGAYNSLTGAPSIPADVSDLTDTTNLLDHFSGSYNDLSNIPQHLLSTYTIISSDGYRVQYSGQKLFVPSTYVGSADILGPLSPVTGDYFQVVAGKTIQVDPEGTGSTYESVGSNTITIFIYDGTEWHDIS